jgi:two-component system LytT family response regulator
MTLRVIVVDDEPPARARVRRLLKAQPDLELIAECGDGVSAVQAIDTHAPDLVLLDVQMPELDGFEVLRALDMLRRGPHDGEVASSGGRLPAVIFVTAFDQYAVRAFEVHALDYVVKPVEADRLADALAHARRRIAEQRSATSGLADLLAEIKGDRSYLTRVPVRSEGRIKVIDLADVDWLGAADNYVTLHAGAREYLVRETLAGIERDLDPKSFVRIHRSTIVRLDRIAELVPDAHGDFTIRLKDGARLGMSRSYRSTVEERFGRKL